MGSFQLISTVSYRQYSSLFSFVKSTDGSTKQRFQYISRKRLHTFSPNKFVKKMNFSKTKVFVNSDKIWGLVL